MERPRVILNCAMTADGKVALPSRKQLRISSEEDRRRVYELRSACDAVLVGIETILSDDPKLTVSEKYVAHPRQPLRVVLDRRCRTPVNALVVNNVARTLIFAKDVCMGRYPDNVEVVACPLDADGLLDLHFVLRELFRRGVRELLVEGGGTILWSFLHQRLADEVFVYVGPVVVGGVQTPTMAAGIGVTSESEAVRLCLQSITRLGDGVLLKYEPALVGNGKTGF
jgi:2,5-diamino-6-(ribosylamino)-4(3H)-pyrimidinone 5'-phosphate reductase